MEPKVLEPVNLLLPCGFMNICYWVLTHWGGVTHICVSKLNIIGSDNGFSPVRCQAIIWTNVGILLIWPFGTNFNETLIEIHTFSFKKMHLKRPSAKWRPFCLCLSVLTVLYIYKARTGSSLNLQMPNGARTLEDTADYKVNSFRPGQNGHHFTHDILKHIFFRELWLKFHWILFLGVQLAIHQHWFR